MARERARGKKGRSEDTGKAKGGSNSRQGGDGAGAAARKRSKSTSKNGAGRAVKARPVYANDYGLMTAFHHMQRASVVMSLMEEGTGEDLRDLLKQGVKLYRKAVEDDAKNKFVLQAIGFLATAIGQILLDPNFTIRDPSLSIHDVGDLFGSTLASIMTVIGAVRLRWSRIGAYVWFRRSQLVSIFIIQVFAFYTEQLGALAWLALDVLFLVVLDYMIREEQGAGEVAPARQPEPAQATAQAATSG